jgi:ribosomal protein L40E
MSIFSKICPRCAGDNPVDMTHCQCGFVFEASATTGSYRALEMAEQEAQVYAEYLQARMTQAKATAEVAINDQARSPGDANKSAAAKSANEDYHEAKAEYDEQMKLVLELRQETENTRVQEKTQKKQASAWEKAKKRTKQKVVQAEKEALIAKQQAEKETAAKKKKQQQVKLATAKKAQQKKLQAEAAAKAAAEKMAARQSARKTPSPKLKQKMANDAEAAENRVRQAQSLIEEDIVAATSALNTRKAGATNSTNKKSAPQQRKQKAKPKAESKITTIEANPKIATNPNQKDCPNCTAIVPIKATKCKCGYGFPQGTDLMDEIGLSEEESANLLSMFQPGGGA